MNAKLVKKLRKQAGWHPNDGKQTVMINTGRDQFVSTNAKFKAYKELKKAFKTK